MTNTQFAAKTGIGLSDAIFTNTHAITSNYIILDQSTNEMSFDQEKAFDYTAVTSLFISYIITLISMVNAGECYGIVLYVL